jgi:replication-associated recombination protein RarA
MPVPSTFLKIGNLYEYKYNPQDQDGMILMVYLGESRDLYQFYVMHDSHNAHITEKLYKITEQQMIRLLHDKQFNEVAH